MEVRRAGCDRAQFVRSSSDRPHQLRWHRALFIRWQPIAPVARCRLVRPFGLALTRSQQRLCRSRRSPTASDRCLRSSVIGAPHQASTPNWTSAWSTQHPRAKTTIVRDVALKWQIEQRADQRSGGRDHPGVHAPLSNPNRYPVYKGRSWPPGLARLSRMHTGHSKPKYRLRMVQERSSLTMVVASAILLRLIQQSPRNNAEHASAETVKPSDRLSAHNARRIGCYGDTIREVLGFGDKSCIKSLARR